MAQHDLSLAKLFEGHTDALAILDELGHTAAADTSSTGSAEIWGVWATEAPAGKTLIRLGSTPGQVFLTGAKCGCSGAVTPTHGLLTARLEGETRPQLVSVQIVGHHPFILRHVPTRSRRWGLGQAQQR